MRRSWLETRVEVSSDLAEAVAAHLVELGSPGLIEENTGPQSILVAYFEDAEQVAAVRRSLSALAPEATITVREISEQDWAENWKVHFPPLAIGDKLLLCPPWISPAATDRVTIVIDPGMAFGTGHHATTRACLELLEGCDLAGVDVLDVGTGSGVLAIAALRLGARRAVGVDTDPIALEAARDNAGRNGVADRFESALSLEQVAGVFDVATANLQLNTLLELEAAISARVRPDGVLIASGLLRADVEAWRQRYAADWRIGESAGDEQWAAVMARRRSAPAERSSASLGGRPRIRVDEETIGGGIAVVTGAELHHLRVRRLRSGDEVVCFDAAGNEYAARVASLSSDSATLQLDPPSRPKRESPLVLTLAQAVLKGDHLDLVVEKTTELGVGEIVLFDCERAVARPSKARVDRLTRIAESAAKQSGRLQVPSIRGPLDFRQALAAGAIVFHPPSPLRLGHDLGAFPALRLVVGPEGGFTAAEIEAARAAGCHLVGLGPRVLRAETAAVVACGLCQYLFGDLGSPRSD
jgi:ribosomal protein L11 methyltransferase